MEPPHLSGVVSEAATTFVAPERAATWPGWCPKHDAAWDALVASELGEATWNCEEYAAAAARAGSPTASASSSDGAGDEGAAGDAAGRQGSWLARLGRAPSGVVGGLVSASSVAGASALKGLRSLSTIIAAAEDPINCGTNDLLPRTSGQARQMRLEQENRKAAEALAAVHAIHGYI
ncbi:hypothetical protein Rsub_13222 [Raphidocelis subcapitata]|uniref:Uncharacterized protein n=1 Tax=Raphidocelis subcapitata TaxID=307507 RepID=A0A2V0PQH3_9CHLO|nr:hypothetical protein Rsub_13222 [Raphidocelis subcapitata]|eukprot:GBG00444.1 hypothetical protein Rsub_13222 [Raphidocelis subcapitata]